MTTSIYKQWYIKFLIGFAGLLLIGFIATSFGNVDRWFSEVMGEWVKIEFIKFWVVFYDEMGNSSIFLIFVIAAIIFFETWNFKNKGTQREGKAIKVFYPLIIAIFVIWRTLIIVWVVYDSQGWGRGINTYYLTPNTTRIISQIILVFIEIGILTGVIFFFRFSVNKSNILIEKRAWIVAVSAVVFVIGTYFLLTVLLKQTFGRPYFLNVEFEKYIGKVQLDENGWAIGIELSPEAAKLEAQFPDLKDRILYSYNNDSFWTQADRFYKWYEINGDWFQNLKFWYGGSIFEWMFGLDPNYTKPPCWGHQDFPSGHTISGFTGIYYALFASVLIQDDKKRRQVTNALFIIWFINEFLMINLLVIARTHYVSDTWFSFVFSTFFVLFSLRISNTWMTKRQFKKRTKKAIANDWEIQENRMLVYIQEDNKVVIGKISSTRINKKVKSYLNDVQIQEFQKRIE